MWPPHTHTHRECVRNVERYKREGYEKLLERERDRYIEKYERNMEKIKERDIDMYSTETWESYEREVEI